jgi:hypothetical protein
VRASCTQCPRRAADAVKAPIRPTGRTAPAPGLLRAPDCASGSRACWRVSWNRRLLFSARHGRLRRNALSHEGVRLSSAPGAPPLYRVLVSKPGAIRILLRDGIVTVPEVFWRRKPRPLSDTKSGGPSGRPGTFRAHPPGLRYTAAHGGMHKALRQSRISGCSHHSSAHQQRLQQLLYRVDGPSGFPQAAENHGRTIS